MERGEEKTHARRPRHGRPTLGRRIPIIFGFENQGGVALRDLNSQWSLTPGILEITGLCTGRAGEQ